MKRMIFTVLCVLVSGVVFAQGLLPGTVTRNGIPNWLTYPTAGNDGECLAYSFALRKLVWVTCGGSTEGFVLLQESTPGTVQTGNINVDGSVLADALVASTLTGAGALDIAAAAGNSGAAGNAVTLGGGTGGAAETDGNGQDGGVLELYGGDGTVLDGAGTADGSGGDVALFGGQRGGDTGGAVHGIVRVGNPIVDSVKAFDLLAVAGGLEIDGNARFDSTSVFYDDAEFASTILLTNCRITGSSASAGNPGHNAEIWGGEGGEALPDVDGQAGGDAVLTGGEGTALNGAGTNDGSGGDVVLTGGAAGGANGTAEAGIVRVGNPTVGSVKAVDLLAVAGGLEVDGEARFDGGISAGTEAGLSITILVRNAAGDGTCTMTFSSGLLTATTCDEPTP